MNEIAVIKQLPVITEKIKEVGKELDDRLEKLDLDNLVCDENSKKEIKSLKVELGKEFKEFENQRKEIKNKIMEPYEAFNKTYEEEIKVKYQNADRTLGDKINEVESELKHKKEVEVKEYFEELLESNNIDFIEFHQTNITITLTSTLKKLKEQAKDFVDNVVKELAIIDTQDYKDEILIEYKKDLNLNKAVLDVVNRHKELDELERIKESAKETVELEEKAIEKVDEVLQAPTEEDVIEGQISIDEFEQEEVFETTFKVRGTGLQIRELKMFLENGGFDYESITD